MGDGRFLGYFTLNRTVTFLSAKVSNKRLRFRILLQICLFDIAMKFPCFFGTISNLQTYILPNLHRKPSIYQPFILPNLHFAKPSNYQISNLQTYILPNLHRKTFNLPILHFTKPTFFSNTQNL